MADRQGPRDRVTNTPYRLSRRELLGSSAMLLAGCAPALRQYEADPVRGGETLPLSPTADETTGLPLLQLPEGFRYISFGWAGEIMADGLATPALHDGMGVIGESDGVATLVRTTKSSAPTTRWQACRPTTARPVVARPRFASTWLAGSGWMHAGALPEPSLTAPEESPPGVLTCPVRKRSSISTAASARDSRTGPWRLRGLTDMSSKFRPAGTMIRDRSRRSVGSGTKPWRSIRRRALPTRRKTTSPCPVYFALCRRGRASWTTAAWR